MPQYSKLAKSTPDHLQEWQQRGMMIPDINRASRYLSHISYYRLSAYTIPFQVPNTPQHTFKANVSFDDVLSLYIFDRELRLLVMDALERIEVAIRTQLCNYMALTYANDPFWYLDEKHFKHEYEHMRLLANIERQLLAEKQRLIRDENAIDKRTHLTPVQKTTLKAQVRKENFLRHYISQNYQPKLLPCWMMLEMLTWGDLSHLYNGLSSMPDQKAIARGLGSHAELLESWLKALNDVRNVCAHHGRLWNKEFGRSIKLPTSNTIRWLQQPVVLSDPHIRYEKRVYPVLVALQNLLYVISPSSSWARRLLDLMNRYPQVPRANMGMPDLWHTDAFWTPAMTFPIATQGQNP